VCANSHVYCVALVLPPRRIVEYAKIKKTARAFPSTHVYAHSLIWSDRVKSHPKLFLINHKKYLSAEPVGNVGKPQAFPSL
jgi:hypothetical protein